MGKAALEGLPGVKRVEKGFKNLKEINRVSYDPEVLSVEDMERVLKKAKTFLGRAR